MTAEKDYFVYLLSCFLNGETPDARETDWNEIYRLADIHDVGGIVASLSKLLPSDVRPQGKLRSLFNQVLGRTLQAYEKRLLAYDRIEAFLNENKIKHLYVKGAVVDDYYPVKELRTSGDIDIIVEKDCLETLYSIVSESDIHIVDYVTETLTVSAYGTPIEIHNNADVMSGYFDDIFAMAKKASLYRYELTDADQLIYVICHLSKHLKYRGAGIRMLMDIDVMLRRLTSNPSFSEDEFYSLCEKAGILNVSRTLISLCNYWFGTPVKAYINFSEERELLSLFEKVLLDGGSFGYEVSSIPARYLDSDEKRLGFTSKIKVVLKMAFPDKNYLKKCYPYYAKNRFLYPFARVNRLFDGVFRKRNSSLDALNQLKGDNSSAIQKRLINELDIND